MRPTKNHAAIALVALLLAACSSGTTSPSVTAPSGPASVAPSQGSAASPSASIAASPSASVAASASAAPTADTCAKDELALVTPGKLTIGTDNPAYPPYFLENKDGSKTEPWELGDPTNGTGFESAVAYAVADQLGFSANEVTWIVVPFTNAFAPGQKTFDLDLNQISYKPERAQTADLSDGYYFGNQSVVAMKDGPVAKVTSVAALKDFDFGVQVGTTSYDTIVSVIAPSAEPKVYDTNDAAIEALKQGTVDAIVVDLPTADFITNVQLEGSAIVGQFDSGTPEHFSAVLSKGSALTACVNDALAGLSETGTLDTLASTWLPFQDSVPVFAP